MSRRLEIINNPNDPDQNKESKAYQDGYREGPEDPPSEFRYFCIDLKRYVEILECCYDIQAEQGDPSSLDLGWVGTWFNKPLLEHPPHPPGADQDQHYSTKEGDHRSALD